MNKDIKSGTLCAIVSALVFGLTPILASMTFDMGSNALTLTFYRNAMAVPVLLLVLLARKVDLRVTKKQLMDLTAVSLLFSVTTTELLYEAYNYTGVGLSTTLHFLYPMFTVLLAWMFYRQKPDKVQITALVLATLGVALATGNSGGFALIGIILAVSSAVTYGAYLLGQEKTTIRDMDSMKAMFYMCMVNAAAVFVLDRFIGGIVYNLDGLTMFYTFIVSVANSAFAYVLLIVAIRKIGAANTAIFSMLEPVSGVVAGLVFLHESAPPMKIISCVIILAAVSIPIVRDFLESKKTGEK